MYAVFLTVVLFLDVTKIGVQSLSSGEIISANMGENL